MSAAAANQLNSFADWIGATDEHAAHHLQLLDRVERLLSQPDEANSAERRAGAARVERWRYQYLNEHAAQRSSTHESFVDALDLAASALRGASRSQPRRTRQSIVDPAADPPALREALARLGASALKEDDSPPEIEQLARRLTQENFRSGAGDPSGLQRREMLLYAPLYVSSECVNWCTYCGFRFPLAIPRKHLTVAAVVEQAGRLASRGIRHVLVVGGDFPSRTTPAYYAEILAALRGRGLEPTVEIAPQTVEGYAELVAAGAVGVTLYQETYDPHLYAGYHPRGPKSSFAWRLEGLDRAAEAGMQRLGLGILLGLADPAEDLRAMMRHAAYLYRRYPDRRLAFSLPRIHEAPAGFEIRYPIGDEQLVRMYCALRIAFPRAVLVLSTREPSALRDRLADICITQMSAGSSTTPGGYGEPNCEAGGQFPIADRRTVEEVARMLEQRGLLVRRSVREAEPADRLDTDREARGRESVHTSPNIGPAPP